MRTFLISIIVAVAAFFAVASGASASYIASGPICTDAGHTVIVTNPAQYVQTHKGTKLGACPVVSPPDTVGPVVTPVVVVIDTRPSQQFVCADDKVLPNAGILEVLDNDVALSLYKAGRAYTPAVVSLATIKTQGYTLIQAYAGGALTCNLAGLTFTGRGYTGDAEIQMQASSWSQFISTWGIKNSLGTETPNGYASTNN